MPVDASIPLQVRQQPDAMQTLGQYLTMAQAVQNYKAQNTLRQAFAGADTSTPQGQESLIKQVGAVAPEEGIKLQQTFQKGRETESTIAKNTAQTKKANWDIGAKAMDAISNVGSSVMMTYADLLHKGVPPAQAQAIVSQAIPSIKDHLKSMKDPNGDPLFNSDQIDQLPDKFDPQATMATVMDAKQRAQYYTQQHQNELSEMQRQHQGVEEHQGQERIGIEAQNAATNRARLGFEESQPKSDVGKINTDLNAGRITKDQANAALTKATGGGDPATVDEVAKHIADGSMQPLTAQALRTPAGMRIMARVYELNPKYDAKDYGVQAKALKDFTTGKQGNTVRSLNVAMDHLDTLSQLGDALKNGNMQAFNKLAQGLAAQTGSAAPTNFDAAKKIVSDEVVKAIIGSGGGVGDRDEAAKAFDKASSPAQLAGAVNTAKRLMRGQLHGLEKQYKESTGRGDFNDRFLSDSARALDQSAPGTPLPGQGPAAANVNKPPIPPTTNAQGWTLHKDKNGNMAYVSPDGKQFQPVQ